jgi:hypothetical protein
MANLRRRIPQQTESLFTENHEPFFNSIDPERRLLRDSNPSEIEGKAEVRSLRSK